MKISHASWNWFWILLLLMFNVHWDKPSNISNWTLTGNDNNTSINLPAIVQNDVSTITEM